MYFVACGQCMANGSCQFTDIRKSFADVYKRICDIINSYIGISN